MFLLVNTFFLKHLIKTTEVVLWELQRLMAFQLISMGKIALRYERIDIRARLRNKLNSYVEVPQYSEDLSLNKGSLKNSIPKSTLHNKITAKMPNIKKMGPAPNLTEEESLKK